MENLTENEVQDILKTAGEIANNIDKFNIKEFTAGFRSGAMGVYTPETQNALMKNSNLNPLVADAEKILSDLQQAKNKEDNIIGYCQNEYLTNMIYKRNLSYIRDLPAFDLSIQCKNAKPDDYKSSSYKRDLDKVKDFINKFDYRTEFRRVFFNMLNSETYYCMLRTDMDEDRYTLQEFPYQYAKITARFTHGLIADYDLNYFVNSMVDINMFPTFIRKKFSNLYKNTKNGEYIPSNSLNKRTGKFALWVQTSPEDGCFVFKMTPEIISNLPYFSPMLADTTLTPIYRKLQLNQSMSAAKKIISSQWPLLKEQHGGNVTDALAVSATTMGQILGAVMSAIGDSLNIINIPSDKIDSHEFTNTDSEAYSNFLSTTARLIGGGNILFSSEKQNATETLMVINIDELLAEQVYPQFENFLDYYVNKLTKKFKFRFKFSGSRITLTREKEFSKTMAMADKGFLSVNKMAHALDMNIFELEDELNMGNAMDIQSKLIPMLNINTMSSKDNTGGRPQKSEADLTDSGAETRGAASNVEKGGNI